MGALALRAEVFAGLDEAAAEELLPEAVDGDARGERVLPARPASGPAPAGWAAALAAAAAAAAGVAGVDLVALAQEGSADPQIGGRPLECGALAP